MKEFWTRLRHCCSEARSHFTGWGEELRLRIDDRKQEDVYPGFCDIRVTVSDAGGESFTLELQQPPLNEEVREFVEAHGGQIQETPAVTAITILLNVASAPRIINGLAKVIRRITRRGERYTDRNLKWICPRTADALERFASALATGSQR